MSAPPGFGTEIHRQRTEIDLGQLSKLGAFQATLNEVAAWFDVSTTTIDERLAENKLYEYEGKQLTFREIFENGKLKGKANLRRLQMIQAEKGNATMLIWLGKQLLGQKDQAAFEHTGKDGRPLMDLVAARALLHDSDDTQP